MDRNDVLREFMAAARRAGCKMTDQEAEARIADAVASKPLVEATPETASGLVAKLRAIKA